MRFSRSLPASLALALGLSAPVISSAATEAPAPAIAVSTETLRTPLEQRVQALAETASVLYIAAHPDDENTQLITYFARGRGLRTAYLSLTRGDGGQNESGPEFGEKLGLARTHELLAARALDGGHQYFTRAFDFGYSKTVAETLRIWNRQEVLADVVRVIREFRPDIIVTRFSPEPGGTHGHHTASAVLALDAFALAGDPTAFPEQLARVQPWQPKRILQNMSPWNPKPAPGAGPVFKIEANGRDPVTGTALASIAAQSRGRHITQGFGNFGAGAKPDESRPESLAVLAGEPTSDDPFAGIDGTWRRFPNGEALQGQIEALRRNFSATQPAASVPALLRLRASLAGLPAEPVLNAKRDEVDALLLACLGLRTRTTVSNAWVAPGENVTLRHALSLSADTPVEWVETRFPSLGLTQPRGMALSPTAPAEANDAVIIPREAPPSQPYWLTTPVRDGLFSVSDAGLIGQPVNPPPLPIEQVLRVGGAVLIARDQPQEDVPDAPPAQRLRPLEIVAPLSLAFDSEVQLFAPGAKRDIVVSLTANRADLGGQVQLELPTGWTAEPRAQAVQLGASGSRTTVTFAVTAPKQLETARLGVKADVGGVTVRSDRTLIRYPHLPVLQLQPAASLVVTTVELATRGETVGYLPGAGDNTVEALTQMGYPVRILSGADLNEKGLAGLDAVVVGVRAFNERTDLAPQLPELFAFVERGGNVIVQYNRPNGLKTTTLAPYELSIAGDAPRLRITDENADVRFLVPTHPALTSPNRLGPADFLGWVQERGAYFPKTWDKEKFVPLLEMNDPGEEPLQGALLIARHGRGHFVYTGLAFFRQLPAGVPGSYRLLANLIALGR